MKKLIYYFLPITLIILAIFGFKINNQQEEFMSKDLRKRVKKAEVKVQDADNHMLAKEYPTALTQIEEAEQILKGANEDDTEDMLYVYMRAQIYDRKRQVATETENKESLLKVCHETIDFLSQSQDWIYGIDPEYSEVRKTARTSYTILAMDALEKATDDEGALKAMNFINECFDIEITWKESQDETNPHLSYYEPKAIIYRRIRHIKLRYEIEYYYTLEQIAKNKVIIKDKQVKTDIENLGNHNPLQELRIGKQGETFEEAIKRYEAIFDMNNPDEESDYLQIYSNSFEFKPPYSNKEITAIEKNLEVPLPASLKHFYTTIAGSGGNAYNLHGLEIYSPDKIYGLMDYIRYNWYYDKKDDSPEATKAWYEQWYEEELTDSDMAYMTANNENYKVVGLYYFSGEDIFVMVYGKDGKMGVFEFKQDTWAGDLGILIEEGLPILKYNSFDELISKIFDVAILRDRFQEWEESADVANELFGWE
ncbi:MAG: SMI1/KNR4 family protein [Dysgonomonas sp.]|nr:SMI1/KNR4 family protein [Dysgonomonas sp.]